MRHETSIDKLTEKQVKNYLKEGGVRCPFCRSDQIQGEDIDIDAGRAYQDMKCLDCDSVWTDTYALDGVI